MHFSKAVLSSLFMFLFSFASFAQETKSLRFHTNLRLAHLGTDTRGDGLGGDNTALRSRLGATYIFNKNHSFFGRMAASFSKEFETPVFTIRADGGGLDYGSVSFDNFFYQFKNEYLLIKAGRFQHTIAVLTNARRSHIRFQSNSTSIHWSDGLYIKNTMPSDWFTELITEYQPRNHTTYPYRGPLDFGKNATNLTAYAGLENRTRDRLNIIQKGFGILYIPDAYRKSSGYSDYLAFSSRIVLDFPKHELLNGGSFRFAGELGQNLNTEFTDGTSMVVSAGLNNVAGKHELMVEFAKTDSQWLTATVYGPSSDEMEIRYRYFVSDRFNIDMRYRIRDSRIENVPTVYSTFIRATLSL